MKLSERVFKSAQAASELSCMRKVLTPLGEKVPAELVKKDTALRSIT